MKRKEASADARTGRQETVIPRWSRDPVVGIAGHHTRISDELLAALHGLAGELDVPTSSVFLTAHAKVLAALSGEQDVSTGYAAAPGDPLLLCRLTTEPHSWRAMVAETHRAVSELLSRPGIRFEGPARTPAPSEPSIDTVFAPASEHAGELREGTVLWVGLVQRNGVELRLRYRTDAVDGDYAARIAGYYVTALSLMAADPDAEHERQSLVSAAEARWQLASLAGPSRRLPDRLVHELFEDRVRAHPDDIAGIHGETQWTYADLNRRANQLARALLAHGQTREGVVAVVMERTLHWMAAVLAVLKAGGVYLPIEPHFPSDRIARMLSQAGCRRVLTERGSAATLEAALDVLPAVHAVDVHAIFEARGPGGDLGVDVRPDQLAYIYFTSGSTGMPKGVMCEHGGMLNHVCAKVQDLHIGDGDVVAQTAPQCFDISLWQLLAAVVAGGRTLIVEQDAILDAGRFLDKVVAARVAVVQVVPSYLEVLLTHLGQHPRSLPDLRYLSVTGEAVKKELVLRWFAVQPAIKLVNAYGLTETSDDTNHEVMEGVPAGASVPLGSPINNVQIYVVDEHLSLVPLGAPGEIVFSGICVGRGYINDPERTRQAFVADPYREGQRLYRSGDYGRWRADGKLEFCGRRDAQVKINGFRIELGEVENALLRVPGVRDAVVVVTGGGDRGKRLVGCYAGDTPLDSSVLREELRASLPEYMVPAAFHWRTSLALTENGKIDRNALSLAVAALDLAAPGSDGPSTATEHWLADAWVHVLGIPKEQIERRHHFFDLGGTSLSALRLAIALDRAVSFHDVVGYPVLADLAMLVDDRRSTSLDARNQLRSA